LRPDRRSAGEFVKKALILLVTGAVVVLVTGAPEVASAQTPTAVGTVMAVSGDVTVTRLAAAPQRLKLRDTLYSRDVVEARKDGIVRVLLGGKTTLTVRELSRLELREETRADGVRYTVELVAGEVRASVARMLMRPGEQVEVRTRNAVASVRGTDFVVETVERPVPTRAFGLVAGREVGEGIHGGATRSEETVVVTLSGVVEVANRLSATSVAERVGAYETARISGQWEPRRVQIQGDEVKSLLRGLTPERTHEARSK